MTLEPPPNGGINPRISGSPNIDDHRSSYSNVQDWPPRHADAYDRDGGPLPKPRYPHIKDLQARADTTIKELSAYIPVCFGCLQTVRYILVVLILHFISDSYPFGAGKAIR